MEESPSSQTSLGPGAVVAVRPLVFRGCDASTFGAGTAAVAAVLVGIESRWTAGAAWATDATGAEGCRTGGGIWGAKAGKA